MCLGLKSVENILDTVNKHTFNAEMLHIIALTSLSKPPLPATLSPLTGCVACVFWCCIHADCSTQ